MKRWQLLALAAILGLWVGSAQAEPSGAASGHEAEAHESHAPWYKNQDLWKIINIGLVVYLFLRFSDGALTRAMSKRSETIKLSLLQAREKLEHAEKGMDGVEYRLAKLHDELSAMKEDGKRVAQAEKERIIREAHEAGQELSMRTKVQIEQETLKAQRELRRFVAQLVMEKVSSDLKQKVERHGDQPFVHSILAKVEALA